MAEFDDFESENDNFLKQNLQSLLFDCGITADDQESIPQDSILQEYTTIDSATIQFDSSSTTPLYGQFDDATFVDSPEAKHYDNETSDPTFIPPSSPTSPTPSPPLTPIKRKSYFSESSSSSSSSSTKKSRGSGGSSSLTSKYLARGYQWTAPLEHIEASKVVDAPPELFEDLHSQYIYLRERQGEGGDSLDFEVRELLRKLHVSSTFKHHIYPKIGKVSLMFCERYTTTRNTRPAKCVGPDPVDRMGCVSCGIHFVTCICTSCMTISKCRDCFQKQGCGFVEINTESGLINTCTGFNCVGFSYSGKKTTFKPFFQESWMHSLAQPGVLTPSEILKHLEQIFVTKGHKNNEDFVPSLRNYIAKLDPSHQATIFAHWNMHRAGFAVQCIPKMDTNWPTALIFCKNKHCTNQASVLTMTSKRVDCSFCHTCAPEDVVQYGFGGFNGRIKHLPAWGGLSFITCATLRKM